MNRATKIGSGAPASPEIPPNPLSKKPPEAPVFPDPPAPNPRPAERPPAEVPNIPTPEEMPVVDPRPTPTTPPPMTASAGGGRRAFLLVRRNVDVSGVDRDDAIDFSQFRGQFGDRSNALDFERNRHDFFWQR